MNDPTNRIRYWRRMRGWSLQQLADASGTSKSQIDKLEKGDRRLTVDWMVRLSKPLSCDPRDLLPNSMEPVTRGHAPALATKTQFFARKKNAEMEPRATISKETLPVLGAARGGKDQEMFLTDGPIDQVPRPHYLTHVKDAYAIYVVGSSMVPMYRPRQLLFVHPYKPPSPGSGVVITKTNGAVLIKEFVKQKSTGFVVREYHPTLRDFTIPNSEINTVHAVAGATEPQ